MTHYLERNTMTCKKKTCNKDKKSRSNKRGCEKSDKQVCDKDNTPANFFTKLKNWIFGR